MRLKPDLVAFPGEGFPVLGIEDTGYIDTNEVRIRACRCLCRRADGAGEHGFAQEIGPEFIGFRGIPMWAWSTNWNLTERRP